ncbi:elongation factor P maturation arginine rhamnosyltransferase EarP [Hydrogenophaga sp. OTU3427]|uniref:elongation factor P maturation arginine rhamnosyltransferase EarP n=1 Tax=Hydrogenophaga sp. OTU3427 TaxID=3043856 RepID=UPI00313CC8FD
MPLAPPRPLWDIFCQVIDNHGDLGVCWRLAAQLAQRGQRVRLWVDDASALAWMAPDGVAGVAVRPWRGEPPTGLPPGDVLVEAFGCDIPPEWVLAVAPRPGPWINLEYLSAEAYVERMHGLPSPVMSGPLAGRTKHFFYPGFTPATGGLLREPDLLARQARFDRGAWLRQHAPGWSGERIVSLFCYEPVNLGAWLDPLRQPGQAPTRLLVAPGRPAAAVRRHLGEAEHHGPLHITWRPHCGQAEFDQVLWASDLNVVRGEDSLVRALWAGQPLIWHIYPQDDGAHHAKLQAFLDLLGAPPDMCAQHRFWNAGEPIAQPAHEPASWAPAVAAARQRLWAQPDLVSQLLARVAAS